MFRRFHAESNLSLEQNTENVPNDNRYYVLYEGKIKGSYKTLNAATKRYKEIFATLGLKAKDPDAHPTKNEVKRMILEQELIADEIFWSTRHVKAKKSGKLRNR